MGEARGALLALALIQTGPGKGDPRPGNVSAHQPLAKRKGEAKKKGKKIQKKLKDYKESFTSASAVPRRTAGVYVGLLASMSTIFTVN